MTWLFQINKIWVRRTYLFLYQSRKNAGGNPLKQKQLMAPNCFAVQQREMEKKKKNTSIACLKVWTYNDSKNILLNHSFKLH